METIHMSGRTMGHGICVLFKSAFNKSEHVCTISDVHMEDVGLWAAE